MSLHISVLLVIKTSGKVLKMPILPIFTRIFEDAQKYIFRLLTMNSGLGLDSACMRVSLKMPIKVCKDIKRCSDIYNDKKKINFGICI